MQKSVRERDTETDRYGMAFSNLRPRYLYVYQKPDDDHKEVQDKGIH